MGAPLLARRDPSYAWLPCQCRYVCGTLLVYVGAVGRLSFRPFVNGRRRFLRVRTRPGISFAICTAHATYILLPLPFVIREWRMVCRLHSAITMPTTFPYIYAAVCRAAVVRCRLAWCVVSAVGIKLGPCGPNLTARNSDARSLYVGLCGYQCQWHLPQRRLALM